MQVTARIKTNIPHECILLRVRESSKGLSAGDYSPMMTVSSRGSGSELDASVRSEGRASSPAAALHTLTPMLCAGCGREVARLDDAEVKLLLEAEEREVAVGAYECSNCEVVLFEDELKNGRFLPYWVISGTGRSVWEEERSLYTKSEFD